MCLSCFNSLLSQESSCPAKTCLYSTAPHCAGHVSILLFSRYYKIASNKSLSFLTSLMITLSFNAFSLHILLLASIMKTEIQLPGTTNINPFEIRTKFANLREVLLSAFTKASVNIHQLILNNFILLRSVNTTARRFNFRVV